MTRRYQVEYRVTPTLTTDEVAQDWKRWTESPEEGTGSIAVDGLDLGESYDIRTRLVDDVTGATSDWVTERAVEVEKDSGVPPTPADIRTTKGDCITWEMPMEVLDLRGFLVRHAPGVHEGWGRAEPAHEGIIDGPPFVLCRVPKGLRTLMVRAIDWDCNESAEASIVVDRGSINDQAEFVDIRTRDESALNFSGLLFGSPATAHLAASVIASPPMFTDGIEPMFSIDPYTPLFSTDPNAALFGGIWGGESRMFCRNGSIGLFGTVYQWIEYVWSYTVDPGDCGPRATLTINADITAEGWRLEYRVNNPLPWIPENPFDPMFSATGADPMFPAQAVKPWRPWPGRLTPLQCGQYDFRLIVPGGHEQSIVTSLSIAVSSEARVRHVTGLVVPALGGTRVPPGDRWKRIVEVRPIPAGASRDTVVTLDHKSGASGPSLHTFVAGVESAAVVDTVVRGY